ncbi:MAG: hypothetical protein FWG55_02160 [Candidatus Bathyarchaeota archaeon]|nr:hypothetical protein [Candidatus Termiticorpusculum sp.]
MSHYERKTTNMVRSYQLFSAFCNKCKHLTTDKAHCETCKIAAPSEFKEKKKSATP